RLAEADVPADEAVHRARRLEVFLHRLDRVLLIRRLAVRELLLEAFEPVVSQVEADARRSLPLCVQREQLACQLADALARARLQVIPGLAAELRERGRRSVGADVTRHLPELLVRDVQPVVAAEREQEVVARDARHLLRLEAEQLRDAVILVDDVVAGAQIRERLQGAAADAPLSRRAAPEHLRIRQQNEPEVAPYEP